MDKVWSNQSEVMPQGRLSRRSEELVIAGVAIAAVTLAVADSTLLAAAVCAGLAVAALLRFEFFVYGSVFLFPWYPLLDANPPFRDIFLLMRFVLLAGVWVIRSRQHKSFTEWIVGNKVKRGVLVLAAIASLSLVFSSEHANLAAYRSLVRLFSYIAVFFAVAGWVEKREQITTIIKVVMLSTSVVALFGFYQVHEKSYTDLYFHLYPLQEFALEPWVGRITSFLFHFNSLAGYLNLVLPFSLACMTFASTRGLRVLGFVCHSFAGSALYFTGSRGGLIAYGGMLLISFWFLKPKGIALMRLFFSLVVAAGLVLSLQQRSAEGGIREVDEYDQQARLAAWGAAGMMFLGHPVLGVGYGNYRSLYDQYIPGARPDELDAHNLYLQFLSETGLIGSLVFAFLVFAFARIALKLARQPDFFDRLVGVGVGGALAATLIHGMVDYIFNASPQSGALLWLILALGWAASDLAQRTCEPDAGSGPVEVHSAGRL